MQFPHTYFEDEIREGFYITGAMKRAWAAQLEVLEEIDKVCKKHNIRWFADCGTLLGAIRHGGYIPWDDDMDICMLRPDYIRFNQIAEQELPEGFVVLNLHKEELYLEYMTRVTNGHRLNYNKEFLEKYHDCPYATGIDIFVLDYTSDDQEEEEERRSLAKLIMTTADVLEEDNSNVEVYREVLDQLEEICCTTFDYTKCIRQQLFQVGERVFALYAQEGGKHVALMPYWIYFHNHLYPSEYFDKIMMVPYEITMMPVPAAYDGVLQIEYGDYMKIVKSGGVHEYPFFEGQEDHLKKLITPYPFEYSFTKEDLDYSHRQKKENPYNASLQFAELMGEAHDMLLQIIANRQYPEAVQLLTGCQESAIQIGNLVEERLGEKAVSVVTVLEQYCELLYQLGELIGQAAEQGIGIDTVDLAGVLSEIVENFKACVELNIAKKRVLFLTYKASNWRAFDSVWRYEKEQEDVDVAVLPIPYFSRDAFGAQKEMYYEGALYPEYLNVQDYQTYDIEKQHPDIIFIQSPYDSYNYTTSVAPQYYSSVIKNYTDKLIYIPWFKADVPSEENQKARKVMDYYCRMPGVVHADLTIVQSEAMRQAYIDYLTEFAGEDTRGIWETKIRGDGSPLDDAERYEREQEREEYLRNMPSNWKNMIYRADGSRKKIILYGTNVATLMQHGGAAIDKIRRSLKIFEESKEDVVLLWRPHPLFVQAIEKACPERIDEYQSMVQNYQNQAWGIYDNTQDSELAIHVCDAYYGDSDSLAHKCEVLKKPVMIENVDI